MTELALNIDLIVSAVGLILGMLGLIQVMVSRHLEKGTRLFFILVFCVLDLYVLCILIRSITRGFNGYEWVALSRTVIFGQALLSSVLTLLVTGMLLYQSGESRWKESGIFRTATALWLVYAAIMIFAQFTDGFYTLDQSNNYERGPLFPLIMIPPLVIMGIDVIVLWQRREHLTKRQRTAFTVYLTLPMLAMILQARLFGVHLIAISTVIAAMVMFIYLFTDQMDRYQSQVSENAQLKIDMLLAQIEPHFIFNTLTTIKYLCGSDPVKAEEAVTKFMSYLRSNMDSLTMEGPIPFEEEMDHVRAYLDLQKIRFGDRINTEYDMEYVDFEIPTLTLLPLVENAVTYGVIRSKNAKGTVTIRTREYPDRIEVSVEDDGPGFVREVMPDDKERSHIGIQNVEARLRSISGGKLRIDSKEGKGTTATIVLIKGENL